MLYSRLEFLQALSAGMAGLGAPRVNGLAERAARLIQAYDQQGLHRTGTAVDQRSAQWLAAQMRGLGVKPLLEAFTLDRVDPLVCALQIGGRRIAGLPLFDGGFTAARGVRGKLGPYGSDAEIGLVEAPPNAEYDPQYRPMRRAAKHRALVLVTQSTPPGLCPINAPDFTAPFGPPVLQVSSAAGDWLKQQAEARASALLTAQIKRTSAPAFNVTAKVPGTNPSLPPLGVMTPRSGWWHCASERGGGLVCWLEVLRALAASKPARDVWFLASSGHELGHLGLHQFLAQNQSLVKGARAWLHFGANIGAAQGAGQRLQASTEEFEQLALAAVRQAGGKIDDLTPRANAPFGEAGNIQRAGGQYISLLGRNALFHHPADRWPAAVDVQAVATYAEAFVQVALRLAAGE